MDRITAHDVHMQLDHNLSLVEYELVRLDQGNDTDSAAAAQPEAPAIA